MASAPVLRASPAFYGSSATGAVNKSAPDAYADPEDFLRSFEESLHRAEGFVDEAPHGEDQAAGERRLANNDRIAAKLFGQALKGEAHVWHDKMLLASLMNQHTQEDLDEVTARHKRLIASYKQIKLRFQKKYCGHVIDAAKYKQSKPFPRQLIREGSCDLIHRAFMHSADQFKAYRAIDPRPESTEDDVGTRIAAKVTTTHISADMKAKIKAIDGAWEAIRKDYDLYAIAGAAEAAVEVKTCWKWTNKKDENFMSVQAIHLFLRTTRNVNSRQAVYVSGLLNNADILPRFGDIGKELDRLDDEDKKRNDLLAQAKNASAVMEGCAVEETVDPADAQTTVTVDANSTGNQQRQQQGNAKNKRKNARNRKKAAAATAAGEQSQQDTSAAVNSAFCTFCNINGHLIADCRSLKDAQTKRQADLAAKSSRNRDAGKTTGAAAAAGVGLLTLEDFQ